MSLGDTFKHFFASDDEEVIEYVDDDEMISKYEQPRSKSVSQVSQLSSDTKMVLFEPRSFEEVEEVSSRLKENRAVVVNLHKLSREYAQRTIDFLSGVIFALDGEIKKIGANVILCAPRSMGVHGSITADGDE